MRVVVSPAGTAVADALASGLREHDLVPDSGDLDTGPGSITEGADAVVIVATPDAFTGGPGNEDALDRATRYTYDLLSAARAAGVARCVYLSSLRLLARYPAHLAVTEGWQTAPLVDDMLLLGCHLGEIVAKEYARERALSVVTVRLGYPLVPGAATAITPEHGDAAICLEDVVRVVDRALSAQLDAWEVVHTQSEVRNVRFLMGHARKLLGFPS